MKNDSINFAANIIRSGGLVAFPTETVYGLGANALNPCAVAKIFETKERPSFDPLIVHISSLEDVFILTTSRSKYIKILADNFWPGPLTIVLPKSKIVPDIVTSGLPTVGIRMPNNTIALDLIRTAGFPIAAPSANKFGRISPTTAEHVKKQLPSLECIIDGGPTTIGIESTVISLQIDGFTILREGVITYNDLLKVIPASQIELIDNVEPASPGLLKSHYSPNKPIFIKGKYIFQIDPSKAGYLSFYNENTYGYKVVELLTKNQNLKEAAVNLFSALHRLEDSDVEYIIADQIPEDGIGVAIMDKLKKASYKYSIKALNKGQ